MAKQTKYYAVARGEHVGIFTNWYICKQLVNGYPGAKYKKFDTFEEAQEYMKKNRNLSIDPWEVNKKIF